MPHKSTTKCNLFKKIYSSPYSLNNNHYNLFNSTKDCESTLQRLSLLHKLSVHNGCVNTLSWNETGEYILSGSDDQRLCITNGYTYKVENSLPTRHRTNIFSAKFLPHSDNKKVVSCSGDGTIIYTNVERPEASMQNLFNCHFGTAYKIVTVPNDPNSFLSCGEDGTVRWYDLRIKQSCNVEDCREDILIDCRRAITALAVKPFSPYELAVGCADSYVNIFDRRKMGTRATGSSFGSIDSAVMRFTVPTFRSQFHRITSLVYSANAEDMLVSYSSEYLYLFNLQGGQISSPRTFSTNKNDGDPTDPTKLTHNPPPMKRWRLRGDWSDTGPNARPEREMQGVNQRPSVQSLLIQRMSDVLTRMLNEPSRRNRNTAEESTPSDNPPVGDGGPPGEIAVDVTTPSVATDPQTLEDDPIVIEIPIHAIQVNQNDSAVTAEADTSNPPESTQMTVDERENEMVVAESIEPVDVTPIATTSEAAPVSPTSPNESPAPGEEVLQDNLQTLEKQLSTRRKHFLKRHLVEPVVNLHYSAQGVTSGLISMGMAQTTTPCCLVNPEVSPTEDLEPVEPPTTSTMMDLSSDPEPHPVEGTLGTPIPIPSDEGTAGPSQPVRISSSDAIDDDSSSESSVSMDEDEVSDWSDGKRQALASRRRRIELLSHQVCDDEEAAAGDSGRNVGQRRPTPQVKQKFSGHRNARTMIKEANFWGNHYVMSGSDCGHIFFWDRQTARVVMILEADHHVVNCIQPHPYDPILASSGIDYDVKLWAPIEEEANYNEKLAAEIMGRNEVMLEETRDTITVPSSFMIRMLASLSHRRTAASRLRGSRSDNPSNAT